MEPVTEPKPAPAENDEAVASPKELALFVVRAVRQNLLFSLFVGACVAALGGTIVSALPDVYDATFKIFIQDGGGVTTSLASGRDQFRPIDAARGLEEFILAHDNLLSIVREARLVDRWPETRAWPMRLKDRAQEYLLGPPDRSWMEKGFVELLAVSITAAKEGESVRVHAQWRDKQSAYDIARLVERNFLAARGAHDLGPIQRALPFLEQQLQEADQEIELAVNRVQRFKAPQQAPEPAPTAQPSTPNGVSASEFAGLSSRLSDVRRQQRALTEPRRSKVAALKLELIDMRVQYSEDHPLVRQQEARIATLSEAPPELVELREEEAKILAALSSRGVKEVPQPGKPAAQRTLTEDPEFAASQARLQSALRKSDETMAKLENARIQLATAEADFKHRYVVVEEPEVPGVPFKPKKKMMLFILVAVLTVLSGIGAGALREHRKGRLEDSWQVRQLGLELLGEVELK